MSYGKISYGVPVVGWPGIIREVQDYSYSSTYPAQYGIHRIPSKPTSVRGVLSLFPKRRNRWIHTRTFGEVFLELYYYEFADKIVEEIVRVGPGIPLLFWGDIRERYTVTEQDWPHCIHKLEINGISVDSSKGRYSPLRAVLDTSNLQELVGERK